MTVKYYECVRVYTCACILALFIQCANRIHCIIMQSVACLTVPNLSTLFLKERDFREIVFGHKVCVLMSSATFV
jgi:hypothetical protein